MASQRALLVLTLAACVCAVPLQKLSSDASAEELAQFQTFKRQFNKSYFDAHDEIYRQNVFIQNLRFIRKSNEQNGSKYTVAMNEFGDLTFEEFHASHTGFNGERHKLRTQQQQPQIANLSLKDLPDSVDWQSAGAVTPVKNQGGCGSCWAFSSTGAIEGAWFIAKGSLVSLSEQELMDCSRPEYNASCEGGGMDASFQYVMKNGLCSEQSYPYLGIDEPVCNNATCTKIATLSTYYDVQQSEDALKAAAAQQPVSVAIEADQHAFQFYKSGVLTGVCGTKLDHGVLVVGYGNLAGTDYWKVKNSWGRGWGDNGYILIERGADECGIHNMATYPVV